MKPLSVTVFTIIMLSIGFVAGLFFSNYDAQQKIKVKKEQLDFLNHLHDFQRNNSQKAYVACDTISNKIFPLVTDGTLLLKGKASKDPIKRLLLESYECISGNMGVLRNYDRQVYVEDSAFIAKYFKLEE